MNSRLEAHPGFEVLLNRISQKIYYTNIFSYRGLGVKILEKLGSCFRMRHRFCSEVKTFNLSRQLNCEQFRI